jgi:peptidoglycan/LPS O-acetylase OafA/YrhL
MKYYPFINGLRAVAVIPVILFHFGAGGFSGGFAGVDVFFVISGFLITGLLFDMMEQGRFSLVHFYERRARRILPALFTMCLLSSIVALAFFMPEDFRDFSRSLFTTALFGSNFTFFRDVGYFAGPALTMPLLHTWSLAVEEQFYILFPLALYGIYRWSKGDRTRLCRGIAALWALSLALNLALIHAFPYATFYLLHTRAWELLTGALVYLYLQDIPTGPKLSQAMSLAGLALLAFSFFAYDRDTAFPGVAALAPCAGAALIIWSNLRGETLVGRWLRSAPLVGVGLVSYGLYLYHWPILVFCRYYLDRPLTVPETAVALTGAGLLAAISYIVIEQPVRTGKVLAAPRPLFLASLLGLAVFAASGQGGIITRGYPARFPANVLGYVADDAEPKESCTDTKEKNAKFCRLGDAAPTPTDFLVWGDSHATKVAPALDVLAAQHHAGGWLMSLQGCEPLLGLSYDNLEECRGHNDKVLGFIKEKNIKTVILAARWDNVLPRESDSVEATKVETGYRVRYTRKDGTVLRDMDAFTASLQQTVAELDGMGVHVWVFKQVPSHLLDMSSALGKAALLHRDIGALNRPIEQVEKRRAPIETAFATLDTSAASFIDPVPFFCADGKECIVAVNGRALYKDDSHLTVYGAMWSKSVFEPVFQQTQVGLHAE